MKLNITAAHEWVSGKDWTWEFVLKDRTGAVIDITGYEFEWVAKEVGAVPGSAVVVEVASADIEVVSGEDGFFRLNGTGDLTSGKTGDKNYAHELLRVDDGRREIMAWGTAWLIQSITA